MSSPLRIFKDGDELAAHAADQIVQVAREAIRVRGRAMVALAGGSTPKKSYRLLAQPPRRGRMDWAHTYLFFGDERFVPPDDPSSNFAMVQETLLKPASVPASRVFPVPTRLGSATAAAQEYAATLSRTFGVGESGDPPRFDLILLGLGDDGHTASLFPHAASLSVTDRWVVSSPPGTLPPPVERTTLTYPVLNAARRVLFLVSGEKKAAVLQELLEGQPRPEERPAAGVRPVEGMVEWLADEAAASALTR